MISTPYSQGGTVNYYINTMINFKQKNFTLEEGHYTGPKDMEDVPSYVGTALKGAVLGAGVGKLVGKLTDDTDQIGGMITGAKYGVMGGIAVKMLMNYLHKPMSSVKYQEVDKAIRRQFGVYQVSGITVGDSLDNRASIDDKFGFNDREVTNYKLSFAIHNNQVTMYTFGIDSEELKKINKSLDYYCKKYHAMNYTAKVINLKANSYAANITFTNYYVLCNFIMELSKVLNTKINILDNNAIIYGRLAETAVSYNEPYGRDHTQIAFREATQNSEASLVNMMDVLKRPADSGQEQKSFSVATINKHTFSKILSNAIAALALGGVYDKSYAVMKLFADSIDQLNKQDLREVGVKTGDLTNRFLEKKLKDLHYIEGFHYTVGEEHNKVQMSIINGIFLVTVEKSLGDKVKKALGDLVSMTKSTTSKVTVFTYRIESVSKFELILKKFMSLDLKPNLFDQKIGFKLFSENDTEKLFKEIIDDLKRKNIIDVDIDNKLVPRDCVGVTGDLRSVKIYLPEDEEYLQYEVEDWIRKTIKLARTNITFECNVLAIKVMTPMTKVQYRSLIEYLVKEFGFCSLLNI